MASMGCAGPANSFDRIGSCPYRGASGWRSQVAPNDKQVGVGACHSLNLPFAWTTLDLADSQKFTDAPYRFRGSARGLPASGSGMTSPSCC